MADSRHYHERRAPVPGGQVLRTLGSIDVFTLISVAVLTALNDELVVALFSLLAGGTLYLAISEDRAAIGIPNSERITRWLLLLTGAFVVIGAIAARRLG